DGPQVGDDADMHRPRPRDQGRDGREALQVHAVLQHDYRIRVGAVVGDDGLPAGLTVGQREVGQAAEEAAEPAVQRGQPVAQVVAGADDVRHAGEAANEHAEVSAVG